LGIFKIIGLLSAVEPDRAIEIGPQQVDVAVYCAQAVFRPDRLSLRKLGFAVFVKQMLRRRTAVLLQKRDNPGYPEYLHVP
jgi:hypothetical protein